MNSFMHMTRSMQFSYQDDFIRIRYVNGFGAQELLEPGNYPLVLIITLGKKDLSVTGANLFSANIPVNRWQLFYLPEGSQLLLGPAKSAEIIHISLSVSMGKQLIPKDHPIWKSFLKSLKAKNYSTLFEQPLPVVHVVKSLTYALIKKRFILSSLESLYINAKTTELFSLLLEQVASFHDTAASGSDKEHLLADKARHFLEHTRGHHFTTQSIAAHIGTNPTTLKYAFKKVYGISLFKYFQQSRMNKADQLLKEGKTVTQVATLIGYSDISHFSYAYKCVYGIAPSEMHPNKQ